MDNKVKLLVIGLGVLAAISLFIAFQLNLTNGKLGVENQALDQKLSQISQENDQLTKKLSSVLDKNRTLLGSFGDLEKKSEGLQQKLDELQERLDLTAKERDNLIDKVQELIDDKNKISEELEDTKIKLTEAEKPAEEEQAQAEGRAPVTSAQQAYWAEVLREKADAELELEQIRSQLNDVSFKANDVLKERDALQMELKALMQEKEDLERRASYNEKLARALSEDLVREKDDK